MVYSEWAGLDSRFLLIAALLLLGVTAVADSVGALGAANTFAEYVFLLLAGGVVLLLVDHLRDGARAPGSGSVSGPRGPTPGPSGQPADERHRAANQVLDRSEQ